MRVVKVDPNNNQSVVLQDSLDAELSTKARPAIHRI